MTQDQLEQAKLDYRAGQAAFERGRYRESIECFEKAARQVDGPSRLGGEIQIWLVTAYQASGQQDEAIALCKKVSHHPDYETAKQGKRLLYILEAPKLKTRPEWITQIPDLAAIEDDSDSTLAKRYAAQRPRQERSPRSFAPAEPQPIDLSQVNTKDNRFVWVALVGILLTLGSLLWLS